MSNSTSNQTGHNMQSGVSPSALVTGSAGSSFSALPTAQTRSTTLLADMSLSAVAAGFLAVLVSYSGPLAIVYQAWQASGLPMEHLASWVWGISMAAMLSGVYLSWRYKVPVVTAWSAPGTALLITIIPGISMGEVVGAYLTAGLLLLLIGISGQFDRIIKAIPPTVACGMMAGILVPFGLKAFVSLESAPYFSLALIALFFVGKHLWARYSLIVLLVAGLAYSVLSGTSDLSAINLNITQPVFTAPEFSLGTSLSFALPVLLVSLTGQFLPGMSILRQAGYDLSAKPIMVATGLTSLLVAFFGGITTTIAAITAALCTSPDAHPDQAKRYIAGISNGVFYGFGALFASSIVAILAALPSELIALIAGLGLLGAISSNINGIFQNGVEAEGGMVAFLVTASGVTVGGLGSAFWGVVLGIATALLARKLKKNN